MPSTDDVFLRMEAMCRLHMLKKVCALVENAAAVTDMARVGKLAVDAVWLAVPFTLVPSHVLLVVERSSAAVVLADERPFGGVTECSLLWNCRITPLVLLHLRFIYHIY